ncbi:MAG: Hpt domain-containing protein [Rhodospirillales bacterium]|tara:strand:- start:913 stop:1710 length:798 start_codon:yes stop_codon:yes gene_type:complete
MSKNAALEVALKKLRLDFIDGMLDRLDEIEVILTTLRQHDAAFDETFLDLQRHIHSIKGQGGTFDFPAISMIAHKMEDCIEVSPAINDNDLHTLEIYFDRIRSILEAGVNPPEEELSALLRMGNLDADKVIKDQKSRVIDILLVMPGGLQRKIIAQELASCGFRLSMFDSPTDAIKHAVQIPPNLIFATLEMAELSGLELAHVFNAIEATKGRRFILMTSIEDKRIPTDDLLPNVAVVRKGPTFFGDLMEQLVAWGLFGNLGRAA